MHRIGVLAPARELPGELAEVAARAPGPVALWQAIVEIVDSHDPAELARSARPEALRAAAERMARWRPDAVAWGCASASFALGGANALAQARLVSDATGAPATSTSLAFVAALAALGADEVALLSPYPEPATEAFVAFLGEWGIAVGERRALGYLNGAESDTLRAGDVATAAAELDGAVPIVVPDTAVWGFELAAALGPRLQAPLLAANPVTLWHALALSGAATDVAGLGALRGRPAPDITHVEVDSEGERI